MITAIVRNMDKWSQKVSAAPANLGTDATELSRATAVEFGAELESAVPVLHGELRDTIKVDGSSVSVGEGVDYAAAVEFGHMDHGTHVPPEPFYYPTLRIVRKTMMAKLKELTPKAFR